MALGIVDSAMAELRSALAGGDTEDDSTEQVARKLRPPTLSPVATMTAAAPSNASDNTYAPGTAPSTPASPAAAATPGFGKALNPPTYTPPDLQQRNVLQMRRDALARPLDPHDPQYKPSFGRKLAGIGAAFGLGFAGKPQMGMETGSNIIRSKYNQAEKVRTADYASAEKDLADYDKTRSDNLADFKAKNEAWQDAYQASKFQQEEGRRQEEENRKQQADQQTPVGRPYQNAKGEWVQGTKGGGEVPWTPQTVEQGAVQETSSGKPGAFTKMWDKERKNQKPDRQPTELEVWRNQFHEDNNRWPTADEIAQRHARKRGTPGEFAGIESKKKQALDKAEAQFKEDTQTLASVKDPKRRAMLEEQAKNDLENAKQQAQIGYEQGIRDLGGSVAGDQPTAQPAGKAVPGKPQQQSAQKKTPVQELKGHKVGDVVTLKGGKRVKIKQLYSDGSFDHEPAS